MKVAVIGSGAAALGVLDRLSILEPRPEITMFDRADRAPSESPLDHWTHERLRLLYDGMRAEHGNAFPPPKTNFGMAPKMRKVEGWGGVWESSSYGGLTNIWGLGSTPFSAHDLQGWPFGRADLDPHYAAMAKRIGIAGERDALNDWLGEDFVNRPPVATTPLIAALAEKVNSGSAGTAFRFVAGASRLAVETRVDKPNSCVACGECMIGCPRQAMHSTVHDMDAWRRCGMISRVVIGRALAVDGQPPRVVIETAEGSREVVGPFDRVYVCAGCISTTEFAMRSLGQRDGPRIVDNSVYTFPIIYWGPALSRSCDQRSYLGLTNLLVNAIPLTPAGRSAQLQVYLMFDHLWRYFAPYALWPAMAPLGRAVRRRVLFVRIFLHGDYSQTYAIHVEGHQPARLSLAHSGTPLTQVPDLWSEIRRSFGRNFLIPIQPTRQRTSSHYSSSLPLGKGPVAMDASIKPGVYLCDSSVFSTAPAASPTFTIMANARRITDLSLH